MPVFIPRPPVILHGGGYGPPPTLFEILMITIGTCVVFGVVMWAAATMMTWFDDYNPKSLPEVLHGQWVWLRTLATTGRVPKRRL